MSQKLINHSPDLKRLQDEGYNIEVKESHLFVYNVPYVNKQKEIKKGTLISKLNLSGDKTQNPIPDDGSSHVAHFTGEEPCHKDGRPIIEIILRSSDINIGGEKADYTFSSKRKGEPYAYKDYHDKMTNYINIVSHPAQSIDPKVTAQTFTQKQSEPEDSPFFYSDTSSSNYGVNEICEKLKEQKVAIIGLGGTGSYVLDLISKTPVSEIHIFDDDKLLNHNAFRTPGAVSIRELEEEPRKVEYLKKIYSNIKKNIHPHPYKIDSTKFEELLEMTFVFVCIDSNSIKKELFQYLISKGINFIDVGMGVYKTDEKLSGLVRTNLFTEAKNDHMGNTVAFSENENEDDMYSTNIQIVELNALNACMAVIKWKKTLEFYSDFEKEHTTVYTLNCNSMVSKDYEE